MARYTSATYRRRRTLWALALTTLGLFFVVYNYGFELPSFLSLSNSHSEASDAAAAGASERRIRVQEIHGLLRVVVQSDGVLPTNGTVTGEEEIDLRTYAAVAGGSDAWGDHVGHLRRETPVIVFSKTYCPYSKRAKALLETYKLVPPPKIVELDQRADGPIIQNILGRLTGRRTVPNILLHGESIGGSDDIYELHEKGELKGVFTGQDVGVTGKV